MAEAAASVAVAMPVAVADLSVPVAELTVVLAAVAELSVADAAATSSRV